MARTLPALILLMLVASLPGRAEKPGVGPAIEQEPFGQLPASMDNKSGKRSPGERITAYTLINRNGAKAKIIDYGGIVTELHVPDKNGKFADVALGFDNLQGYLKGHPYFGANVGRCANRIGNAQFTLDGKAYKVTKPNDSDTHTLHGGKAGFDKKVWRAETIMGASGPALKLAYISADGEEGYPGQLSTLVQYMLTNENELRIDFSATTNKPTICNLAHHSYFNLAGHNTGEILNHEVEILAKNYTPGDASLLPTGKIAPVAGTPFDFTTATAIGKRIKQIDAKPQGYDLNYVLDNKPTVGPVLAARVTEPTSGRVLEVLTTEPGLQFYTGNFLDGSVVGKGGAVYKQYNGFCLEAQKFPDSINKPEWKDVSNVVLRPGEEYKQTTIYKFSVKK